MNMLDVFLALAEEERLPTKSEFGKKMHDDSLSEEEKQEILNSVYQAGGYDNLED